VKRLATAFLVAVAAVLVLGAASASAASPGAAGIGDRLFPGLGNGGYDVQHYDLDLRYATDNPAQSLLGTATITARATQSLSRFDLDYGAQGISAVTVNGSPAQWSQHGEELVITPSHALSNGSRFVVKVVGFRATPTPPNPDDFSTEAFFITPDGSATAPQPNFAHLIYPSNDHPSDKATFTFRIDVPAGEQAFANGDLVDRRTHDGRTLWTYEERDPMATELTQIATGHFDVTNRGSHRGIRLRDVTSPTYTDFLEPDLAREPGHIDWLEARLGAYPFDIYGSFVVNANLGFALETQTLSLYDNTWFTDTPQDVWEPTMVHELSHMWFGDSVAPRRWSDLWINEGHASWFEFIFAAQNGFLEGDTENYPDENGYANFNDLMRAVYAHGDQWRADWGPVAKPTDEDALFTFQQYHGGALVLYALRQKVGAAMLEHIDREWLRHYRGRSAGTRQYIRLAARVAHRPDLRPFLRDWLYGTKTPPMPGHPNWTVDPVQQSSARALGAQSEAARHLRK
jgi:aminopeptidase N